MKLFIYVLNHPERVITGDPDLGTKKVTIREKVVFYEERHAATFAKQPGLMKEFLGLADTDVVSGLLEKTADELRALNLSKTYPQPRQTRDQIISQLKAGRL